MQIAPECPEGGHRPVGPVRRGPRRHGRSHPIDAAPPRLMVDCRADVFSARLLPLHARVSCRSPREKGWRAITFLTGSPHGVAKYYVDNDLVPRPDQDVSEERRLLYVALARST